MMSITISRARWRGRCEFGSVLRKRTIVAGCALLLGGCTLANGGSMILAPAQGDEDRQESSIDPTPVRLADAEVDAPPRDVQNEMLTLEAGVHAARRDERDAAVPGTSGHDGSGPRSSVDGLDGGRGAASASDGGADARAPIANPDASSQEALADARTPGAAAEAGTAKPPQPDAPIAERARCASKSSCALRCTSEGTDECTFACSDTAECELRCEAEQCNLACKDVGTCTTVCPWGSSCDVSCENSGSCDVRCEAGSVCTIHCAGSNCSEIECDDEALCNVDCADDATCNATRL